MKEKNNAESAEAGEDNRFQAAYGPGPRKTMPASLEGIGRQAFALAQRNRTRAASSMSARALCRKALGFDDGRQSLLPVSRASYVAEPEESRIMFSSSGSAG